MDRTWARSTAKNNLKLLALSKRLFWKSIDTAKNGQTIYIYGSRLVEKSSPRLSAYFDAVENLFNHQNHPWCTFIHYFMTYYLHRRKSTVSNRHRQYQFSDVLKMYIVDEYVNIFGQINSKMQNTTFNVIHSVEFVKPREAMLVSWV